MLFRSVNAHLDLDATETTIRQQHALYGPISAILVEDKANGSSVIQHLKTTLSGVIAVNPEGGKLARMVAAAPEFQAHDWFIDRRASWRDKFVEQITCSRTRGMMTCATQCRKPRFGCRRTISGWALWNLCCRRSPTPPRA